MYTHVLVPVSFDEDRDTTAALKVAEQLCTEGGKITVLHVMEEVPTYAINYLPADYRNESRIAIRAELDRMSEGIKGAHGVVVDGHSGRTILEYAEEHGVDCIVLASHKPGMSDYIIGGTAAHVVRHAPCAVHVVR